MDLLTTVITVSVAAVGGALSWVLKKVADKSNTATMDVLMDRLDNILLNLVLPPLKSRMRQELRKYEPQHIENKYVGYVLDQLGTIAPKIISQLGFTEQGLTEYVRGCVQQVIEDLVELDDAKAQEG
jgi:hypothetical protein